MQNIDHAYKRRSIKTNLQNACLDFLAPVREHDPTLYEACYKNIMICGGSIASMYLGERPRDYDFYFKDFGVLRALLTFYLEWIKYEYDFNHLGEQMPMIKQESFTNIKGIEELRLVLYIKSSGFLDLNEMQCNEAFRERRKEGKEYLFYSGKVLDRYWDQSPKILTGNAITSNSGKYQLIFRFYGTPEDIFKNFDFRHAMASYELHGDKLNIDITTLETIISKTLIYQGSLYPIATLFRVRKFLKRGWRISAGQLVKIAHQISEDIDFKNIKSLEDQLMGVDIHYMIDLVNAVKAQGDKALDQSYLATLIDRIFEGQDYDSRTE